MKSMMTVPLLWAGMELTTSFFTVKSAAARDMEVRADEVVDRQTLKTFVLQAKKYLESLKTVAEVVRLQEIFTSTGYWKSGTMFLMIVNRDGVVLLHGGGSQSVGRDASEIEDGKGVKVVQEFIAKANAGGGFVEYFWDDPAVEGDEEIAKLGYAAECWENLQHQEKLVLIGGFSRDLSDLPAANPSLEPPKIRASEVVGRESLKAFVREARDCYDGLLKRSRQNTSAQLEVILQIAALFRREGGYWKSGSTYIFIVTREGFVVFHGANQSYEGRTLLDVEDINGVKVVRELIAAADAGGGFVEYYMDDPSVEGDEDTGSPKVGYAMSFNSQAGRPFIIGSGFYAGESTSLCH